MHHIYDLDFRIRVIMIFEREREIEEEDVMVNTRKIMTVRYGVNLERFMLRITLRVEFLSLREIGCVRGINYTFWDITVFFNRLMDSEFAIKVIITFTT